MHCKYYHLDMSLSVTAKTLCLTYAIHHRVDHSFCLFAVWCGDLVLGFTQPKNRNSLTQYICIYTQMHFHICV